MGEASSWTAVLGGLVTVGVLLVRQSLDARRLNVAILAEVKRLYRVIAEHRVFWGRLVTGGKADLPLIEFSTPVFGKQAKNIGKVDDDAVADVVSFYGYLGFINELQRHRAEYVALGKGPIFNTQYLRTLNRFLCDYDGRFTAVAAKYDVRCDPLSKEALAGIALAQAGTVESEPHAP